MKIELYEMKILLHGINISFVIAKERSVNLETYLRNYPI